MDVMSTSRPSYTVCWVCRCFLPPISLTPCRRYRSRWTPTVHMPTGFSNWSPACCAIGSANAQSDRSASVCLTTAAALIISSKVTILPCVGASKSATGICTRSLATCSTLPVSRDQINDVHGSQKIAKRNARGHCKICIHVNTMKINV